MLVIFPAIISNCCTKYYRIVVWTLLNLLNINVHRTQHTRTYLLIHVYIIGPFSCNVFSGNDRLIYLYEMFGAAAEAAAMLLHLLLYSLSSCVTVLCLSLCMDISFNSFLTCFFIFLSFVLVSHFSASYVVQAKKNEKSWCQSYYILPNIA